MKAIFLIFCFLLYTPSALATTPGEVQVGSYLPDATLQGLLVKSKKLSEFRGKPLIINVWASWCGPCREEMGSLARLSRRLGGKEFNIIGISTDDDTRPAVNLIVQSRLTFSNFIDKNMMLENMLGANTIPLTILVDANGRVLKKVRGFQVWDSPESIKQIGRIFQISMN